MIGDPLSILEWILQETFIVERLEPNLASVIEVVSKHRGHTLAHLCRTKTDVLLACRIFNVPSTAPLTETEYLGRIHEKVVRAKGFRVLEVDAPKFKRDVQWLNDFGNEIIRGTDCTKFLLLRIPFEKLEDQEYVWNLPDIVVDFFGVSVELGSGFY